ncbi:bumetanide-sensitive sodium-(potassium)-chloride cotransporter [Bombyx mandarina]|uniref:Bumetanide-sensitive sodium-(Potassium)-chloride cotransporter n=1 Tax=Bombyx mandarina TaxID=7092 RepID=A0A6J2KPK8_BOMMA|nr:bumetanide-sensitive sodium-(potassium)-chloride cotransporter [Bombyx mandarina]XP_028043474.1 bumetanide-sensitive sodium-(potassium)-chloride cotransporter [Bombyx mandarina]XP_028043475.1 bumetanide-sensitive sodium-(potassium)-chloride cotransporter [Bombyx mandarina]
MEDNRFVVSTVEGECKKNGIHMGANIISRPLRSSLETVERGVTNAQPDTWLHDAGWRRKRSLAQLTREALPRMENYRNSKRALKRPSLGELHGDHLITEEEEKTQNPRDTKSPTPAGGIKLGWIQGVLIPCLLNIWGVMLFLRISWVVSQAGIGWSLVIIALSAVVCVITTLSMSAICTNGEVKGGGIYYIISRSLGPEFGASVGIIFAFANAVAASMNTIGFCDSMNHLLKSLDLQIIDNSYNDVRIIGAIALFVMCVICAVGMDWESKAQNFLIAIIVGAIVDFVVGAVMGPKSNLEVAEGFVGLSTSTFVENFNSDFKYSEGMEQNFFSVFAIFFPSVTGIQAGANISGDLKDPASAIPKGTLLALLISMVSYAMMVLFTGAAALRDASGNITDLVISNGTVTNYSAVSQCANSTLFPCKYGMHVDFEIMQLMSAWGPFIYAGCWAATLSTALTNLLSVPRLIQALGVDRIYPGLIFFSKPYGRHGEAYRGYVLTFLVSLLFLLIAKLNAIAPLISNFYLASYALINFCTFHAALVRPLGWRPTFKYYNVWVSLAGFLMCVGIMLLISWIMSLVTIAIFFTLYLIVHYRNPDVNWGSSTQAQMYKTALSSAHNLARTGEHVKNYWPQLLVLGGRAHARPPLVDLGSLITKAGSLMIIGDISKEKLSYKVCSARARADNEWLQERKVRAFCSLVHGFNFEQGARALIQATGVGKLAPNVLLMGYKSDWTTASSEDLVAYFNVLHTAFENRLAVAIVRVRGGLDYGAAGGGEEGAGSLTVTSSGSGELHVRRSDALIMHADSDLDIHTGSSVKNNLPNILTLSTSRSFTITDAKDIKDKKKKDKRPTDMHRQIIYNAANGIELSKDQLTQMSIFKRKQESGTVDVWWLYDDGGLTILLPYIISQRSAWGNCKLRIFALANRLNEMELEERNMANLLSKFRIDYSSLTMVQDITEPPQAETKALFDETIKKFTSDSAAPECRISETELTTLSGKTNRQLRLRELLLANSRDSRLIVMSLPMPRKGSVSAPLYMAWLEMMSRDLPPMLFVRGNHTSVLTFYS